MGKEIRGGESRGKKGKGGREKESDTNFILKGSQFRNAGLAFIWPFQSLIIHAIFMHVTLNTNVKRQYMHTLIYTHPLTHAIVWVGARKGLRERQTDKGKEDVGELMDRQGQHAHITISRNM